MHKIAKRSIPVITALILGALLLWAFPLQLVEASPDWWDISYQYRRQITVFTGINSPYNGYAGYTVEFTMNTISPSIQDDGDDLRIVWWNGIGWQELDRHIIDPNTASTIIQFRLQADIAASSSDNNYYVYYGNAAVGAGQANLENVYLHYNNHSTDRSSEYYIGRLGITNWHGSGGYSPPYDAGNQRISYDTDDNFVGEWVVADINERDVYLECQMRDSGIYPTNTTPGLLARVQWATLGSSINDFYAASFAQGNYNESGIGRNARNALASAYDPGGTKYYSNNTVYRFYFAVWGINTTFKADFVSDPGRLQWKPGATPYVNSSSTEASDLEASGPVGFLLAQQIGWIDEFMVRRYIEPEPTITLAAEETVTPPTVTTNDASNISINSATINGSLDNMGTAASADVSFEWGQTSGGPYPNETTPQTMNTTGAFSFDLSSLTPNTTYYFRAKAIGDGTSYGTEKSFTTLTPPTATTNDASSIGVNSATINGSLNDMGTAASVDVSFEWGQTSGGPYPNETTPQTVNTTGAFSFNLSSLTPNTTYYFRAKAVGDGTSYGTEKSFTTLTPPTVTTNDASNISINSATINGSLDDTGTAASVDVSFEWGHTSGGPYSNETTPQTVNTTGAFSFNLSSLTPNTTYYFRAKAVGDGTSYGTDKSFTTLTPEYGEYDYAPYDYYLEVNALGVKKRFDVTSIGRVLETIDIVCSDGVLNIHMDKGTVVQNKQGRRLRTLEIAVVETPFAPTDGTYILGQAYSLLPNDATFDPSMTLTWSYVPNALREGAHEEDLFLALYDKNAGIWVKLDCMVDVVNHTITAEVGHSTTFAVLGLEPKSVTFTVNNLIISPDKVNPGEIVNIGVSVVNSGDLTGSHKVILKIDDMVVTVEEIVVPGHTARDVVFELSRETIGSYSVDVNGLAGSFIVEGVIPSPIQPPTPTQPLTPPNPPAPKSSNWLLIVSIAVVVVIVGSASYFFAMRRRNA